MQANYNFNTADEYFSGICEHIYYYNILSHKSIKYVSGFATDVRSSASYEEVKNKIDDISFVTAKSNGMACIFVKTDTLLACLHVYKTDDNNFSWFVEAAATSEEKANKYLEYIKSILPPAPILPDNAVKMNFYYLHPSKGPQYKVRDITASNWEEVRANYAKSTRDKLASLMKAKPVTGGGKLILLHGQPGLGKTYAIRALAQEWKNWCATSYIVDPDKFFTEAAYLLHVLLNQGALEDPEEMLYEDDKLILADKDKWNLLIIEDSDEYLVADSKLRSGQGLSRLLNTADGLVGQGLKILLLFTTNEKMSEIHPAIARPGRCLANIEFQTFDTNEAKSWLKVHGVKTLPSEETPLTLANLYNHLNQEHIKTDKQALSTGQYL